MHELHSLVFYGLAFLALVFGFLVVANPFSRSPVNSAMFLVLTIGCVAGLFALLHAFFLAAVQVLVYAGAVMVLFLFVIMMLDLPAEEQRKLKTFSLVTGLVATGAILSFLLVSLSKSSLEAEKTLSVQGSTIELGRLLFSQYLLPFEIVSVLLLVAMVGVVLLSKKELK